MKKFDIKNFAIEIKLLIIIGIISGLVMILQVFNANLYAGIIEQFALFSGFKNFKIWQLATYSFIHSGLWHLGLNLLMLYFFSMLFFTFFNQKQFLKAYFLGGIASGVFYFLILTVLGLEKSVVGASGAVMAVFFTVVGYNPKMNVHLMIFGRVALWKIALVFIAFDVIQLFFDNAGGHLAHLGGSIFGFGYGKYLEGFTFELPFKKKKSTLRTVHKVRQSKKPLQVDDVQQRIDVILDKISKSGYDSLTKEEKEFLFRQK